MIRIACLTGILFTATLQAQDAASLASQEARLSELRQVYTDNHPSVRKAKADLENARRTGDVHRPLLSRNQEIAARQAHLAALREVYTEKHPAVKRAKSDLEALLSAQEF